MVSMVNVGGRLYPSDSIFYIDRGTGPSETSAAGAAAWYNTALNVQKDVAIKDGWSNYDGYIELKKMGTLEAQKPAAEAPAPRAAAPRASGSALTAPAAPALKEVTDRIEDKEREQITPPAEGLESTIKTAKINPQLLREKRRRSYLTAGS